MKQFIVHDMSEDDISVDTYTGEDDLNRNGHTSEISAFNMMMEEGITDMSSGRTIYEIKAFNGSSFLT